MIEINWNPLPHLGPIPINWYGFTFLLGFLIAARLVIKWAPQYSVPQQTVEGLLIWVFAGVLVGARLYYVAQNDLNSYLAEPWRVLAVWEGGLAFFGGLFGATLAAYVYCRRTGLRFLTAADLFAPAIPIGAAIGRISCGLDGMDYGTPTALPWGVVYTNPNSYAPIDGIARHPDQFYELAGDLIIAASLLRLRNKVGPGVLFFLYLVEFATLRFFVFFVRGNAPVVAFGLKNAQLTALAILAWAVPMLAMRLKRSP
ncbi:MAG TPA: prolipoprotein diacylglyceryl transferase [Terriglobales bacterium]|nr:prolipoprotein diacylglyceryl transferase [Terriglobales bacterium]